MFQKKITGEGKMEKWDWEDLNFEDKIKKIKHLLKLNGYKAELLYDPKLINELSLKKSFMNDDIGDEITGYAKLHLEWVTLEHARVILVDGDWQYSMVLCMKLEKRG